MKKTTIYEADDGFVRFEDDRNLFWHWDNGPDGEGDEIIPLAGAADYFESAGREDITELIRNRETYSYGRYGQF